LFTIFVIVLITLIFSDRNLCHSQPLHPLTFIHTLDGRISYIYNDDDNIGRVWYQGQQTNPLRSKENKKHPWMPHYTVGVIHRLITIQIEH